MRDLVAWLNGCYDRAEQRARAAFEGDPTATGHWHAGAMGIAVEDGDQGVTVAYDEGAPTEAQTAHIVALDPSWRLADIGRKRKILAIHRTEPDDDKRHWRMPVRACVGCGWDQYEEAAVEDINDCPVVRLLAEEFAGEPGYDESWRP